MPYTVEKMMILIFTLRNAIYIVCIVCGRGFFLRMNDKKDGKVVSYLT